MIVFWFQQDKSGFSLFIIVNRIILCNLWRPFSLPRPNHNYSAFARLAVKGKPCGWLTNCLDLARFGADFLFEVGRKENSPIFAEYYKLLKIAFLKRVA